jgi:hypothetical protein
MFQKLKPVLRTLIVFLLTTSMSACISPQNNGIRGTMTGQTGSTQKHIYTIHFGVAGTNPDRAEGIYDQTFRNIMGDSISQLSTGHRQIVVPAILAGAPGNDDINVKLLVDTGCEETTLYFPNQAVLDLAASGRFQVTNEVLAGGRVVPSIRFPGRSISVGGGIATLQHITVIGGEADTIFQIRNGAAPVGSLGMDFLAQFVVTIDYEAGIITLTER